MINLNSLTGSRTLVVGDVMLDSYWTCAPIKISPEAPIPVLQINDRSNFLGGAANVVANINALGGQAHLIGIIGSDISGEYIMKQLSVKGISHSLLVSGEYPTINKLRIVSQGQQIVRVDEEHHFNPEHASAIIDDFQQCISDYDVIVISDYNKGTVSNTVSRLIEIATAHNKHVIVDPKGLGFEKYSGSYLMTPNRHEFESVFGRFSSIDELVPMVKTACHNLRISFIAVTLGPEGILLAGLDIEPIHLEAIARNVYDVTGAGDTVVATLAACASAGIDISKSTWLSNIAASISVTKHGPGLVSIQELDKAVEMLKQSDHSYPTNTKYIGAGSLDNLITRLRSQKLRIAMTNGCFDIFHAGHASYLRFARSQGDVLIVALNSDESVKRLKGNSRPVNSIENRISVLEALESVDYIVSFDENTPEELYARILPDVLVKGDDYENVYIAGSKEVIAAGGRVVLAPMIDGLSTTSIISRAKKYDS